MIKTLELEGPKVDQSISELEHKRKNTYFQFNSHHIAGRHG